MKYISISNLIIELIIQKVHLLPPKFLCLSNFGFTLGLCCQIGLYGYLGGGQTYTGLLGGGGGTCLCQIHG